MAEDDRGVEITLDEDVAAKLEAEAQRTGTAPRDIANATLRQTLRDTTIKPKPFTVRPRHMGAMAGLDLDCIERLLNQIEGPNWK